MGRGILFDVLKGGRQAKQSVFENIGILFDRVSFQFKSRKLRNVQTIDENFNIFAILIIIVLHVRFLVGSIIEEVPFGIGVRKECVVHGLLLFGREIASEDRDETVEL